jgi:hypothetical protein
VRNTKRLGAARTHLDLIVSVDSVPFPFSRDCLFQDWDGSIPGQDQNRIDCGAAATAAAKPIINEEEERRKAR